MTANSMTLSKCHRRIEEMMPYGLDGIEAYYPEHTQVRTGHVLNLAKEFGLLVSGGTDFHGRNMPNISIGYGYGGHYHVPDSLLIPMRERLAASGTP
jgi:predicted metal-dependent phosphoesterase TrpH